MLWRNLVVITNKPGVTLSANVCVPAVFWRPNFSNTNQLSTGASACLGPRNISFAAGICNDAVVNITYEIEWNATNVVAVSVSVYVANVNVSTGTT